ncbi:MAG: DNA polymerase III subunit beta [Bacteroidia bacterium]|nr:DNA polymerase III subunit beta [Bacteroidia bacterium]
MGFLVSSAELQHHLSLVGGIVPSKAVLPIIQNIRLRLVGDRLHLSATDLDSSIETQLRVEPQGDTPFDLALPAKLMLDTVKALPEQPITFEPVEDQFSVRLLTENGQYELSGANGQDFPSLPQPDGTTRIELPLQTLVKAIDQVLFAASTDELKPALNGMFFDLKSGGATFVATDAHRLVRYRRLDISTAQETSFILPQKALKLLANAAGSDEEALRIEYNPSHAFFHFGDTQLSCRLIDARFPDYENVIPAASTSKLIISKRELLGSMRRLDIYSNKSTHLGRFRLSAGQLAVQSEDPEFANRANETLRCIYEGEPLEIGFNVSLLLDILGNIDTEDVVFELDSPGRAAVILPSEQAKGEHVLMLLMPVMLSVN